MPLKNSSGKVSSVGKKIKKVRSDKKITLDLIANETGLTIENLKEIESGKIIPAVGTLLQIARALKIDSGFFLREQESNLEKRVQAYTIRTDNYAYETLTPGAESKHIRAFRITVDPMQDHKGVGYQHEGEEFVYVLSGMIEVTVGEHVNILNKDGSLHFNSGIIHHMRNIGNEIAVLLVVIYGP